MRMMALLNAVTVFFLFLILSFDVRGSNLSKIDGIVLMSVARTDQNLEFFSPIHDFA
jgi:hypothetical protein